MAHFLLHQYLFGRNLSSRYYGQRACCRREIRCTIAPFLQATFSLLKCCYSACLVRKERWHQKSNFLILTRKHGPSAKIQIIYPPSHQKGGTTRSNQRIHKRGNYFFGDIFPFLKTMYCTIKPKISYLQNLRLLFFTFQMKKSFCDVLTPTYHSILFRSYTIVVVDAVSFTMKILHRNVTLYCLL